MNKQLSPEQKAYFAGFLDGDGSIYVQLKPNSTYRYGFQVAPYIVLYQSQKSNEKFAELCEIIGLGYMRQRSDGISEYIIGRIDELRAFLGIVQPYVILKVKQVELMLQILDAKESVKDKEDFQRLAKLVDRFRELNYSKKRKNRIVTP